MGFPPSAESLVAVFTITALFDVALNVLPPPIGGVLLRPYFVRHTVLAAALIAGFAGAITLIPIAAITDTEQPTLIATLVVFAISAGIGFPMQWSRLFPHLDTFYYGIMPRYQSFLADGLSGLMVTTVYWFLKDPHTFPYTAAVVLWLAVALVYGFLVHKGVILYKPPHTVTETDPCEFL